MHRTSQPETDIGLGSMAARPENNMARDSWETWLDGSAASYRAHHPMAHNVASRATAHRAQHPTTTNPLLPNKHRRALLPKRVERLRPVLRLQQRLVA